MEELVDGAEIDGKRIYLAAVRSVHAVRIVGEFRESVRILPHALDVGVEQVGAVLVDFDTSLLIEVRCGVAADTGASVDDEYVLPAPLRDLLGDGQAEKASSDDEVVVALGRDALAGVSYREAAVPVDGHVR